MVKELQDPSAVTFHKMTHLWYCFYDHDRLQAAPCPKAQHQLQVRQGGLWQDLRKAVSGELQWQGGGEIHGIQSFSLTRTWNSTCTARVTCAGSSSRGSRTRTSTWWACTGWPRMIWQRLAGDWRNGHTGTLGDKCFLFEMYLERQSENDCNATDSISQSITIALFMCTQYYYIAVLCFELVNLVMISSTANYSIYTLKLNLPLKKCPIQYFCQSRF